MKNILSKEAFLILGGVILIVGMAIWGMMDIQDKDTQMQTQSDADIIYYFGDGCPHCDDVHAFLEENNVEDKVDFATKEVWKDAKNSQEMQERAQTCDITSLGVPFLYARGECFVGAPDVIEFFETEMQ